MKLNESCMKHIVEYCIEKQTISPNGVINKVVIRDILNDISVLGYDKSDIWYSIRKLKELSYITIDNMDISIDEGNAISDVTVTGHKYATKEGFNV